MNRRELQPKAEARIAKFKLLVIFLAISLLVGSVTSIQGGDIYDYLPEGTAEDVPPTDTAIYNNLKPLSALVGFIIAGGYQSDSPFFEREWLLVRDYYKRGIPADSQPAIVFLSQTEA